MDSRPSGSVACVVVGAGPIGSRVAQTLARSGMRTTILGDETFEPYNRVRLTPLLGGEAQLGEITLEDMQTDAHLHVCLGQRVVRILRGTKQVATADGQLWSYDKLVLATGSRAFIPDIPGRTLSGVFRFRSADDASALLARSFSARRVAVIGGGLLGLEAARGMAQRNCHVTVLEHESHLMPRQLDKVGGALLSDLIEVMGVEVRTGVAVRRIDGTTRVTGLTLSSGERLDVDTVIVCTGIRPNVDLARSSGLAFGRGITVNERMQTTDPDIFAVGECAEFDGQLFGLVGPGYLQAEVATSTILHGGHSAFDGASPATKLKIIGADVFSVGDIAQLEVRRNVRSHDWRKDSCYRRIFIERGKIVGALSVGQWLQASRMQDAVNQSATVYPWMLYRFRKTGSFWPDEDLPVDAMPDAAVLCNCTGVTCGQIRGVLRAGCVTVDDISAETSAGTVCGTCRPLIGDMIEAGGTPEPLPLWKPMLAFSGLGFVAAAVPFVLGNVPLPTSYDPDSLRDWLWRDNIVKQWSGFSLLGLVLAAFAIGLRKRIRFTDRFGSYDAWRLVHNGIGLAALAGFFVHTGFKLGSGWNLALGLTFVGTVLIGSVAGLATGGDHELRARQIGSSRKPPRRLPIWAHILLLWPLPALITFHVLASYAF